MTFFYNDILNQKCNRPIKIFIDENELIKQLAHNNTIESLSRKITIIMQLKDKIKININNGLLIDKLILELIGGE